MIITNEKKGLGKYPQEVIKLENEIQEVASNLVLVNSQLSEGIANAERNIQNVIARQGLSIETMNLFAENARLIDTELQFANIDNANMNNAYIENLVVNRPVFDMILNDAHLDNVGVTSGNLYNVNLFNFAVPNLLEQEPEDRPTAVGFDAEGHLIPIHATYDAELPKDAGFIKTDATGTPLPGNIVDELDDSDSLVTSSGIKNAIDTNLGEVKPVIDSILGDLGDIIPVIDTLKSTATIDVNTVALRDAIRNGNVIQDFKVRGFSGGSNWSYAVEPSNVGVMSIPGIFYKAEMNEMVNVFENSRIGALGPVNFSLPMDVKILRGTFKNCYYMETFDTAIPSSVNQLPQTFANCYNLSTFTDKVKLPSNLESMAGTFAECFNLTESNLFKNIPESCNYFYQTFGRCTNFNQPITFTNDRVSSTYEMFKDCSNFNSVVTGNYLNNATEMFYRCSKFNAPVNLERVNIAHYMFANCYAFNQPINFFINGGSCVFADCYAFNQNIDFLNKTHGGSYDSWFMNCGLLDQDFVIPIDATGERWRLEDISNTFRNTWLSHMPMFTFEDEEYTVYKANSIGYNIAVNNAFAECTDMNAAVIHLLPFNWATNMFRNCTSLHPEEIYFPPIRYGGYYDISMVNNMFYGCNFEGTKVYVPNGDPYLRSILNNGRTGYTFDKEQILNYTV